MSPTLTLVQEETVIDLKKRVIGICDLYHNRPGSLKVLFEKAAEFQILIPKNCTSPEEAWGLVTEAYEETRENLLKILPNKPKLECLSAIHFNFN